MIYVLQIISTVIWAEENTKTLACKITEIYWKRLEMVGAAENGWTRLEMAGMARMAGNGWKWYFFWFLPVSYNLFIFFPIYIILFIPVSYKLFPF